MSYAAVQSDSVSRVTYALGIRFRKTVAKAPPDGHTLLYYGNTLWLLPLMRKNVPYDALRDFLPITMGVVAPSVMPHVRSGRLRALAVTSTHPAQQSPDLPTIAASGLPGYESLSMTGLFVPAKTPEAVVSRLNQEIVQVLRKVEIKSRFLEFGVETVGGSPQEFTDKIRSEISKWGQLIKEAGIRDK